DVRSPIDPSEMSSRPDDFKRFKFELRDEIVPELIPEEFLSDAAREDLAKEMIQRYTEKDALELTFRILERMGKRGLLEKVKSRCLHIRAEEAQ
uniref:Pyrin domain-containing protein n=1 Tax=Denticeps clupeoides TaxID=299321 RepID=A0AAY4CUW5_9TELE